MSDFNPAVIVMLFIGLMIYFLPSVIGMDKRNSTSIFLLNLFLGWSLIGWVVAIVWATAKDNTVQKVAISSNNSLADEILKLEQLRQQGILNSEEFAQQKKSC